MKSSNDKYNHWTFENSVNRINSRENLKKQNYALEDKYEEITQGERSTIRKVKDIEEGRKRMGKRQNSKNNG